MAKRRTVEEETLDYILFFFNEALKYKTLPKTWIAPIIARGAEAEVYGRVLYHLTGDRKYLRMGEAASVDAWQMAKDLPRIKAGSIPRISLPRTWHFEDYKEVVRAQEPLVRSLYQMVRDYIKALYDTRLPVIDRFYYGAKAGAAAACIWHLTGDERWWKAWQDIFDLIFKKFGRTLNKLAER